MGMVTCFFFVVEHRDGFAIWVFIEAFHNALQITEANSGEALNYKEVFHAF